MTMWRMVGVLLATMAMTGSAIAPASMKHLVFLTRDGCVNTPDTVNNLDDLLTARHWPKDFEYIDIGTLAKTDVRTGYPTPTMLWKGRDIFGMPVPKPPFDAPS